MDSIEWLKSESKQSRLAAVEKKKITKMADQQRFRALVGRLDPSVRRRIYPDWLEAESVNNRRVRKTQSPKGQNWWGIAQEDSEFF
jgi:hypothetical protein